MTFLMASAREKPQIVTYFDLYQTNIFLSLCVINCVVTGDCSFTRCSGESVHCKVM